MLIFVVAQIKFAQKNAGISFLSRWKAEIGMEVNLVALCFIVDLKWFNRNWNVVFHQNDSRRPHYFSIRSKLDGDIWRSFRVSVVLVTLRSGCHTFRADRTLQMFLPSGLLCRFLCRLDRRVLHRSNQTTCQNSGQPQTQETISYSAFYDDLCTISVVVDWLSIDRFVLTLFTKNCNQHQNQNSRCSKHKQSFDWATTQHVLKTSVQYTAIQLQFTSA